MNRFLVMALCLVFSLQTFANEKAVEAAAAYSQRDFNEVGIQNAAKATTLYGEAIAIETVELTKLQLMLDLASAHYFLGTAMDKKADRKEQHQNAMDTADAIMTTMGVDPTKAPEFTQEEVVGLLNQFDSDQELVLADAMYSKGINLAHWGNLNGIASSIGKLPKVLGLMERIEMMGYESIHEYGPYRTIGRINFVLPSVLGGDLSASERYLSDAYRSSLVTGQRYSMNAYNNIYYAETLHKSGKENQAKRLLDLLINADIATLKDGDTPENREALKVARELAEDWA